MCHNFIKLNETESGILIYMSKCKKFQLTFNNLCFSLSDLELKTLKSYLQNIDIYYWEKEYENSIYEKRIPIPTLQNNFIILINPQELYELINLISFKETNEYLNYKQIKYPLNPN